MNNRLVINDIIPDAHSELLVERGKNGLGVGSWVVRDKYRLLCTYIDAARGAANKFSHWIYIDPFCGPGRIQQRDENFTRLGGAPNAWMQSSKSGRPFDRVLVGDIDTSRLMACEARLKALKANVTKYEGPANETVLRMVADVPRNSLCLVYIDPYNLALLSFEMIKTLAKLEKVDFVVHFSTMDLYRNVDAELDPERARFDEVAPGWQGRIGNSSKTNLPIAFFDDWNNQVKGLGFSTSKAMPLITNDSQQGLYRLVFFARHELPLRIWGDVARDPNLDLFSC